jgi:hypothetical protein
VSSATKERRHLYELFKVDSKVEMPVLETFVELFESDFMRSSYKDEPDYERFGYYLALIAEELAQNVGQGYDDPRFKFMRQFGFCL